MNWDKIFRRANTALLLAALAVLLTVAELWPGLGLAASIVATVGWSVFVFLYWRRTRGRWRQTREGRQLMWSKAVFALIMLAAFTYRLVGEYPGRKQITAVLLTLAAWFAWGWVRLLLVKTPSERKLGLMSEVGMPTENRPVETKVKASTAGAGMGVVVAGAIAWLLDRYAFGPGVIGDLPDPINAVVMLGVPMLVAFGMGYAAKHTRRLDLPPVER